MTQPSGNQELVDKKPQALRLGSRRAVAGACQKPRSSDDTCEDQGNSALTTCEVGSGATGTCFSNVQSAGTCLNSGSGADSSQG